MHTKYRRKISAKIRFERRSQSDCVHEQVAKADCECPLYKEEKEGGNQDGKCKSS